MRTIHSRLFISYSILIIILIFVLFGIYYLNISANIKDNATLVIQDQAEYISSSFENQIKSMSDASNKYIFSDAFKDLFYNGLNATDDAESLYTMRELTNWVYSISGPDLPFMQVNFIHSDGRFFCTGNYTNYQVYPVDKLNNLDWIDESLSMDGKKTIRGPHADDFEHTNIPIFSVYRAFSRNFGGKVDSVIEVQQKYSVIESTLNLYTDNQYIFVYDRSGKVFNQMSTDQANFWVSLSPDIHTICSTQKGTSTFSINGIEYIAGYAKSDYTGHCVVVVKAMNNVLLPINSLASTLVIFGLITLLSTLTVSYFVSRGLTTPIKRVHNSINSVRLETLNLANLPENTGKINELQQLDLAFAEMCNRLKISLNDIVALRTLEIEARLLAYQSQMSPHFLYNILSIIGINAENGNTTDVSDICRDLSDMLRYIAIYDSDKPVTIVDELDHTMKYVTLMNKRYPNAIKLDLNVPASMFHIKVPRLIIQPIVENCFKYGVNRSSEWNISISGSIEDDIWSIVVRDDGNGFIQETIDAINEMQMNKSWSQHEVADYSKIGLRNILMRLYLIWSSSAALKIMNSPKQGASVEISATINWPLQPNEH